MAHYQGVRRLGRTLEVVQCRSKFFTYDGDKKSKANTEQSSTSFLSREGTYGEGLAKHSLQSVLNIRAFGLRHDADSEAQSAAAT